MILIYPKVVCGRLVDSYVWDVTENQDLQYKWLPVSRPKSDISCVFTKCDTFGDSGSLPDIAIEAEENQN